MNNDRFQKWYSVYYVKFNLSPLGDDENDVVRFKFGGSVPIPDGQYLLTEGRMPYGLEDTSGRILHDGLLVPREMITEDEDAIWFTENEQNIIMSDLSSAPWRERI